MILWFQGIPTWEGNKMVSCDETTDGRKHKMTWEIVDGQLVKVGCAWNIVDGQFIEVGCTWKIADWQFVNVGCT